MLLRHSFQVKRVRERENPDVISMADKKSIHRGIK